MLELANTQNTSSIRVLKRDEIQYMRTGRFSNEYELGLLQSGELSLRIDPHEKQLAPGDFFLLGPGLSIQYDPELKEESFSLISICFQRYALGKGFFELPELGSIRTLLHSSHRGLIWLKQPLQKLAISFEGIFELNPAEKLIQFLNGLHNLSLVHAESLIPSSYTLPALQIEDDYFTKILDYIYKNFDKPISLEDMASLTNLNKYSFCRYFKKMTQQSFISYLNEFRINKACSFLSYENYNISQIGYLVGFNTLSNFYSQFQKIMKCTPSEYREELS